MAKPTNPVEKYEVDTLKLFFSSLSRRMANYCYIDNISNNVTLSNLEQTDSDNPMCGDTDEEEIEPRGMGELFYHFVEFPNPEYRPIHQIVNKYWAEWLQPASQLVTTPLCYYLSRTPISEFPFSKFSNGKWTLPKSRGPITVDEPTRMPIQSDTLHGIEATRVMLRDLEVEPTTSIQDLSLEDVSNNNKPFFFKVDNQAVNIKVLLFDGITHPSISEFHKRLKPQHCKLTLFIGVFGSVQRVWMKYISINPDLVITSYQPANIVWI